MPESQKQHHTPLTSFRCITMTTCPTHFYTNSGWAHSIQVLLPLYLYWGITVSWPPIFPDPWSRPEFDLDFWPKNDHGHSPTPPLEIWMNVTIPTTPPLDTLVVCMREPWAYLEPWPENELDLRPSLEPAAWLHVDQYLDPLADGSTDRVYSETPL